MGEGEAAMDHTILAADTPAKFQRTKGKGVRQRGPDDGRTEIGPDSTQALLRTLAKYVSQHAMSLQLLEVDRSWRRQLLDTTEAWRKARVAGSCTSSLRQTLLGVVWMELEGRLKRAETEQPTMDAMLKSGLATMTANQPQWKYVTWSPEKGTHIPALEKEPLSQQNALEAVRMLKLMATKGAAVQRFHALGKMTAEASSGATAFMLTLSLDF